MLVTIISALTIFVCFIKEDSTVVVAGKQIEPVTIQKTFSGTLASAKINVDENDTVDKSLNDVITVDLKVLVDGKVLSIKSTKKTIALMLISEKITLSATDKVSPSIETELSSGMEVTVTRVKIATIKETKPIPFNTVIKNDNNTLKSKSRVSQVGKPGEKSVTTNVTYENGKAVTSNVIKETVIKAPQSKIIVQGTLKAISFSRGGTIDPSTKIINVKATAYCPIKGATNTYTASGKKAVRDPFGYSTIAVDPNVIPMGTRLYVEGYGYAIAADKGSAVKGKYIDVFFNTLNEALDWGVKNIKVQIIN
ncbi:3D domain-containing protein [Clostridium sp. CF012]|uniref:3D domain-containing protein n=1 Tax=Clostridium sp. CF012 TaxID=2843319 RepID=UPI001C0E25CF|nr:3D domain-containing protein [Clostridium sp. CF012]MBU3144006.1 G5 domain-containing protein [Clostridium sp. CF012]